MKQALDLFEIIDQGDGKKAKWIKIGCGFINRDGSVNFPPRYNAFRRKFHLREQRRPLDYYSKRRP